MSNIKYPYNEVKSYVEFPLIKANKIESRLYQQLIVGEAINKNTLVVLPTALGKTIISALVSAYFLYNYPNMRILIMAPTRPLVLQHRESYLNVLKLPDKDLVVMTGKLNPEKRKKLWTNGKVFFATPQIVRNDLEKGSIFLEDFSLLVFDEAHRAVKAYAYTYVAKNYMRHGRYPIILALTASPGSSKEKVQEVCSALSIEKVVYRSEQDEDVAPYVHGIGVEWKQIALPEEYKHISKVLKKMLTKRIASLKRYGLIRKKTDYVSKKDILDAGGELRARLEEVSSRDKGWLYAAIVEQSAALSISHALELLQSQGMTSFLRFLEKIGRERSDKKSYRNILNDPFYREVKTQALRFKDVEHPKVDVLKGEVKRQLDKSPSSKVLVFTQYRATASHLVELLSSIGKVERFVGQASRSEDTGLTQDEQREILQRYRNGETNILVATSIAEEGLDIPNVDLVVFYEPVPSEIRFIQRKGRTGRKSFGRALILAAKDSMDVAYYYSSQRKVAKMRAMMYSLNKKLSPISRQKRPESKPLTEEEILKLEEKAKEELVEERAVERRIKPKKLEPVVIEKPSLKGLDRQRSG
jgi:Fanconi anemia group M protein